MITRLGLTSLVLAVGAAAGLFVLKDRVRQLENELSRLHTAIRAEHATLDRLRAEWAMLNQPGRLARLAREHLHLQPAQPGQIVTIDEIPMRSTLALRRLPLRARLPSGAEVPLRLKPAALPGLLAVIGPVAGGDSAGSAAEDARAPAAGGRAAATGAGARAAR